VLFSVLIYQIPIMNLKKLKLSVLAFLSFAIPVNAVEAGKGYQEIINKDPDSNFVFLFVYRSTAYLDWSNPSDLAKTTLVSQLNRRFKNDASSIGHAQVAWHCNDGKGNIISGATGQTGQEGNEGLQLVKDGWGLSVLDAVFTDGSLESEQEVVDRMQIADKHNNFAWMAVRTNYQSCSEMSRFVKDYDKSGAAVNYGFPVEPLKFEGAGCTSFANAAISKTNLNLPISAAWVRHIKIPLRHMGKLQEGLPGTRPLEVAKTPQEVKKVPITDFIFKDIKWAQDGEAYKDFYYYDPELFYESLVHLENKYRASANMRLKNPVRTKEYDSTQLSTKKISENWLDQLISENKMVKMAKIYNTTGLIIEP
jgi:hypothetical protein